MRFFIYYNNVSITSIWMSCDDYELQKVNSSGSPGWPGNPGRPEGNKFKTRIKDRNWKYENQILIEIIIIISKYFK